MSIIINNMLKEKLQEFGFSDKEAKVYLALVEMGSAVASDIAKKAGINRSTTYVVLDSLSGRGLISAIERRGIRTYQAASPEQLVQYLQGMAVRYTGLADRAKELLPELPSPASRAVPAPRVRFFEGEKGIKTVYEDTLSTLEQMRVHAAFAHGKPGTEPMHPQPRKVGVKMQIVFPAKSPGRGRKTDFDQDALREIVLASRQKGGVSSEINIYDDRVVFISTAEDFALVVESRELADALRKAFAASEPEKADAKKAILRPSLAV